MMLVEACRTSGHVWTTAATEKSTSATIQRPRPFASASLSRPSAESKVAGVLACFSAVPIVCSVCNFAFRDLAFPFSIPQRCFHLYGRDIRALRLLAQHLSHLAL